ncbi:MAG: BBE domain-containing protein [Acidobacteriia bacterium]|nr:BBE domain-containing protein [Terriglobia bacterium]
MPASPTRAFTPATGYRRNRGDRACAAIGASYDRFAQLETGHDPTNFFRFEQNIPPATKLPVCTRQTVPRPAGAGCAAG